MEHFYKDTDGENWFNYPELYREIVSKAATGAHFVEVGTWKGMSACFMAVEIINSGKNIKFDCVDTWEYTPTAGIAENAYIDVYSIFLKNISPVQAQVNPIKALSWEAADFYKDESLDFVFIDAEHTYEAASKDIAAWYPKLKKTGVIAGHDYISYWPGVVQAVNEFFGKVNRKVATRGTCWFVDLAAV